MFNNEGKNNISIIFGMIISVIMIMSTIVYAVYGIKFLIEDYSLWSACEDSSLWIYSFISIILFLNKLTLVELLRRLEDTEFNSTLFCSILLEAILSIWGGMEVFYKLKYKCDNLKGSNLWKFSLTNFILQNIYIVVSLISIITISIIDYINNKKIKEDLKKLDSIDKLDNNSNNNDIIIETTNNKINNKCNNSYDNIDNIRNYDNEFICIENYINDDISNVYLSQRTEV